MKLKRNLYMLVLSMGILTSHAQEKLSSPDGNLTMSFSLDMQGSPVYELSYKGKTVIKPSKLGLELVQENPNKQTDFEWKEQKNTILSDVQTNLYNGFELEKAEFSTSTRHGNRYGVRKKKSATITTNLPSPLNKAKANASCKSNSGCSTTDWDSATISRSNRT